MRMKLFFLRIRLTGTTWAYVPVSLMIATPLRLHCRGGPLKAASELENAAIGGKAWILRQMVDRPECEQSLL